MKTQSRITLLLICFMLSSSFAFSGKTISWLFQTWQFDSWNTDFRRISTFDDNKLQTYQLVQNYVIDSYKDNYCYYFKYNAGQKLTEELKMLYQDGKWVNSFRMLYDWDKDNKILAKTLQDFENGEWVNQVKYAFEYDSLGRVKVETFNNWLDDRWDLYVRNFSYYDNFNNEIESVNQRLIDSVWQNYGRAIRIFKVGKVGEETFFSWLLDSLRWEPYTRHMYAYDLDGRKSEWISLQYYKGMWLNDTKENYRYFKDGKQAERTVQRWKIDTWEFKNAETDTFDAEGYLIEHSFYEWKDGEKANKERLLREDLAGVNDAVGLREPIVYPNPANDRIFIESGDFEIKNIRLIDAAGKRTEQGIDHTLNGGLIDVSKLAAGIYMLEIRTATEIIMRRFVVSR